MGDRIPNILIVDDSKINTFLLETILRKNNWNATSALSVATAMDLIKAGKPDLILLDLHMPGADGFNMLDILNSDNNYHDIPVIVMSASNPDDIKKRCLEKGVIDFEPKPVNIERLSVKVKNILKTRLK